MGPIGDWTYRAAAYFCDHVIHLRFHSGERSEVLPVVKSHVCVRMEQEPWWLQQNSLQLANFVCDIIVHFDVQKNYK